MSSRQNVEGIKNSQTWDARTNEEVRTRAMRIDRKRKENELLKEQIEKLQRSLNMKRSIELGKEITALRDSHDKLRLDLKIKKRQLQELNYNARLLDERLMDARVEMGGVNVAQENTQLIHKQIKILENRLDKALVKFNEVVADNKSLRDKIENLRQERIVFDNIYKKMERELEEKKKEMAAIIEESNEAYEERDQIESRIMQEITNRQEEMAEFEQQSNDLDKIIELDKINNEKLQQQEKELVEQEILSRATLLNDEDIIDGTIHRTRAQNGSISMADQQKPKHVVVAEKIKHYEDSFKKIEASTGLTIDELIEKFSIAEDNNFSLFTYVNELNAEIEKLEEEISELEEELEKYKGGEGAESEAQHKQQLNDLQKAVIAAEELSHEFKQRHSTTSIALKNLCAIVEDTFAKLGCDAGMITELLGTAGVTESNLMVYLGIIEQRTNELLQRRLIKSGDTLPDEAVFVVGPKEDAGPIRFKIEPPSTGSDDQYDDDSDDEEKPLTRELLARRSYVRVI